MKIMDSDGHTRDVWRGFRVHSGPSLGDAVGTGASGTGALVFFLRPATPSLAGRVAGRLNVADVSVADSFVADASDNSVSGGSASASVSDPRRRARHYRVRH